MAIPTIVWSKNCVRIIDQRQLPRRLTFIRCQKVEQLWQAIKVLAVRGAPALGAAAAFGVLLGLKKIYASDRKVFDAKIKKLCAYIGSSRPTAVNLFNALDRMQNVLRRYPDVPIRQIKTLLHQEAMAIFDEDRRVCRQMGAHGAKLIQNGFRVLTICNAGALATVDFGTALGVMYSAKKAGKKFRVFACETRPLLQGARLTTWELTREHIDTTLICDNMAASLMVKGSIDIIFVGADRIASNGDTANKIGTYNLAVLACYHKIPFYVVAPEMTLDKQISNGKEITIEERDGREITCWAGRRIAPTGVKVYNPAFDVTPHQLITGIVTEKGIIRPPLKKNIQKHFMSYAD